VDSGYGPARGATLCDTRGRYDPRPASTSETCTVVLATDGTFGDALTARLCGS
jgi:purine nucleosidase